MKDDLKKYRMYGLPLLAFMGVLVVISVVVTVVLHYWF